MRFGMIGFGEVGGILSAALRDKGAEVAAFDLRIAEASVQARARTAGVRTCESSAALMADAEVVVSAVTASSTLAAAEEAARTIRPGSFYLDLNSASPDTKARCAKAVDAAGAKYVEAGVMTSVPPYGIKVPMVIGGRHAADLQAKLAPYGFAMEVVSETIGVASAIKMCRSVIIKGMEAIVIESFTTARRHGVEARVLESLQETFPGLDWEKQGSYFFSRVVQHGKRRSEEMKEAAVTVREAGFDPFLAAATSEKQGQVAKLAAKGTFAGLAADAGWREHADRLIGAQVPAEDHRRKKSA